MANLTEADRKVVARTFVDRVFVGMNRTAILTGPEVKLMIDGIDVGLNAAASDINQSIDASVRSKATTEMKNLATAYVALKRAELSV